MDDSDGIVWLVVGRTVGVYHHIIAFIGFVYGLWKDTVFDNLLGSVASAAQRCDELLLTGYDKTHTLSLPIHQGTVKFLAQQS
jgi:hypothetical protein